MENKTIECRKAKCNNCNNIIYSLNTHVLQRDNLVTIDMKNFYKYVYLCDDCKERLKKYFR